jgi:hypothetical protein
MGVVGHDRELMGGMVASFMTFPERGLVVSVTSNISYADTFSLAVKIAQAFAEQRRSPARKMMRRTRSLGRALVGLADRTG